jgi:hypothetical protein
MNHSIPRVPFVIGVTGNMDPLGYDDACTDPAREAPAVRAIREKVWAVLDWVRHRPSGACEPGGWLDPDAGRFHAEKEAPCDVVEGGVLRACHSCWRPLGLRHTPIVVLSSLAPGVDTLVAEAALYYAAERGADVTVRAPLPFPIEGGLFRRSSSFHPGEHPESWTAKERRFDRLVERLGKQDGFEVHRDLFCVALDNDLEGDPATDLAVPARRRLRYRAAGEFIAAQCHLLLAIYDEAFDEPEGRRPDLHDFTASGSAVIVEAKRSGLAYELLAVSNNFAWADNGPVLRIPIHRKENKVAAASGQPCTRPLAMLHPYDLCPEAVRDGTPGHPKSQRAGDVLFRRIVHYQEEFNALPPATGEDDELAKALRTDPGAALPPNALALAQGLAPLAALRRRAATLSRELDARRQRLLVRMLLLIAVAAMGLGTFEHWHDASAHHPPEPVPPPWLTHGALSWTQVGLLLTTLLALLASGIAYHRHVRSHTERRRHDARALAEGLRVQLYWCLCGTGCSASADYMQRQRGELDWIRHVIAAAAFPLERWWRGFLALTAAERHALLAVTHRRWIGEQREYFAGKVDALDRRAHRLHRWAWGCGAAGLISVVFLLAAEVSPRIAHYIQLHHWPRVGGVLLAWGAVVLLRAWWCERGQHGHEPEEESAARRFAPWLFARRRIWGLGLGLAALVIGLPPVFDGLPIQWPDWHNWWVILTGLALLAGGLCLAWAERNFLAEQSRQYAAARDLFACADRRLAHLLERLAAAADGTPACRRLLAEIHDLLHQLGCEALDENAEWLILHRARPLEPFMAG